MPNALANVPADSDLLCERCGYVLTGLTQSANCPECGQPIEQSQPALRQPPAWEQPGFPRLRGFLITTTAVLLHPTHFYRAFAACGSRRASRSFATIHVAIVSVLIGIASYAHFSWFLGLRSGATDPVGPLLAIPFLSAATFLFLDAITRIASRLTAWEAAYRGLRLPLNTVLRALDYHSAHYIPVAVVTLVTILGYRLLLHQHWIDSTAAPTYLYALCGEVILAAIYLFKTYWIAMRNLMYANG